MMNINNMLQQNVYSIRQAIGIANIKQAMHQDAQSVAALIEMLPALNAKAMENSITPHKGSNIDTKV
ncbi:MAG: putative motility protein [Acetivibrionales bacterium]|jgi:hypothetical protein